MDNYYIDIIESETGKIHQTMGPKPQRQAEKIEDGININLNHEKFHTELRKVEESKNHAN